MVVLYIKYKGESIMNKKFTFKVKNDSTNILFVAEYVGDNKFSVTWEKDHYREYDSDSVDKFIKDGSWYKINEGEDKMNTLSIQSKFIKGDKVYIINPTKDTKICSFCNGKKKIEYNNKIIDCPECHGVGNTETNRQKWIVLDSIFTIIGMKINIGSEVTTIKYKLTNSIKNFNRAGQNTFSTKEEAQMACDKLNQIKEFVNLNKIHISDDFAETIPNPQNIADRVKEYKTDKKFNNDIIVNSDYVLIDGYTTYLVCKMFEIENIKVIIK
jgi:hypothetical protein